MHANGHVGDKHWQSSGKTKGAERTGGGVYPEVGLAIGTGEGLERWGYWKTGEGIEDD